jgi:hypothetical protein
MASIDDTCWDPRELISSRYVFMLLGDFRKSVMKLRISIFFIGKDFFLGLNGKSIWRVARSRKLTAESRKLVLELFRLCVLAIGGAN